MLWATIDMEQPVESTQFILENTGEPFTWIYPLHCLLLTGSGESYYFNDPLAGKNVPYPKGQVKTLIRGWACNSGVGVKPSETGEPAKGQALLIV